MTINPHLCPAGKHLCPAAKKDSYVLIVDAYSGGREIARNFKELGYRLWHLTSGLKPDLDTEIQAELFIQRLEWNEGEHNIINKLIPYPPLAIIPGCESAVWLAEYIAGILDISPRNDSDLAEARIDKYKMLERLKESGIRSANHHLCSNIAEVEMAAESIGHPLVLKPRNSAGSDGVIICDTKYSTLEAARSVLGSTSKLSGRLHEAVVIESFLLGKEYIVNTITRDGHIFFSEFLSSIKENIRGRPTYRYMEILSFGDPAFSGVAEYCRNVHDALGIRIGAAHFELKIDDAGPTLIEVGSRISGAGIAGLGEMCYKHSSKNVLVDCYMSGGTFSQRFGNFNELNRHGMIVCLYNGEMGVRSELLKSMPFEELESYSDVSWNCSGEFLPITVDLFTSPALVKLVHSDRRKLFQDLERIREWESTLYSSS